MSGPGATSEKTPRFRAFHLRTKLILFGTLVTLLSVASAFIVLSVEIRAQTRSHLVELLREHQTIVRNLQQRKLEELVWTSGLMTQSPTLRAALDTYQGESAHGRPLRADLLATIRNEVEVTRGMLGKDLVLITDEKGRALSASFAAPPIGSGVEAGQDLSGLPIIRRALDPAAPSLESNFAVFDLGGRKYQVGSVPIILQDYIIGTLTLGEELNRRFLGELQESLHCDALLSLDDEVLDSTLKIADGGRLAGLPAASRGGSANLLMKLGTEEYVTAALPLGVDDRGRAATLLLLQSLTRSLRPANRSLWLALVSCGSLALLVSGLAAWGISRSLLNPLERFVAFMRSVAETGDHSRRYPGAETSAELHTLNQAYGHLMDSLQEHERRLMLQAREDLVRVERLKESEKLASLGRMLSGAAHEINNPLTGVAGNIDLLLRSENLEGKFRDRLERVRGEANRIIGLVRNLLKVARRDKEERKPVDLQTLIEETVTLRRHDFATAGISLRLELPPARIRLLANSLELQQVFLNIINNALDVLKDSGRPEPALTIRAIPDNEQVTLTFSDNGPGMTDPRKVFDHFYTTKEVGKGTGLGLSITHAIVLNHGGAITAANRPEGGACFTVTLPLAASRPTAAAPEAASAPAVSRAVLPFPPVAVLLVEDEPSILDLQASILLSLGARPTEVRTGDEALRRIQSEHFDLIVADLKLPGGRSGQDLFRWALSHQPAAARRFVFVTGDTANPATRDFLEKSGRPHLSKPFTVEDYVSMLRETLDTLAAAA